MTDAAPLKITEDSGDPRIERSITGSAGPILEAVQVLGGPTAVGTGIGVAAKYAKDIIVAKIEADAKIEVARIENRYRAEGGEHRAD